LQSNVARGLLAHFILPKAAFAPRKQLTRKSEDAEILQETTAPLRRNLR